jgi:hypothetical protein
VKRTPFIPALAILVVVSSMLSSCATLFVSRNQKISVKSVDTTYRFTVNGKGTTYSTPCTIEIRRSSKPFELHIQDTTTEVYKIPSSVSALCYSNLIGYGNYLGLIVDLASGKGYNYPKRLLLTDAGVECAKYSDTDSRTYRPRQKGDVNYFISWPLVCGSHYSNSGIHGQFTNVGIVTTGFEVFTDAKTSLAADYGYNFRSGYNFGRKTEVQTHFARLQLKYNKDKWSIGGGMHLTYQELRNTYTYYLENGFTYNQYYKAKSMTVGPSLSFEYHVTPGVSLGADYLPSFTNLSDFTDKHYQDFWIAGNLKFYIPLTRGSGFNKQFDQMR